MSRPSNSPFARPPAKAMRSSTSDVYVAPELRSSSTLLRTASTSSTTVAPSSVAVPSELTEVFENPTATTTTPATVTTSTVMTAATMDKPVAGVNSSREYDGVNGRSDSDICGIFNDYHSPDNGGDSRVREHTGTSAFSRYYTGRW